YIQQLTRHNKHFLVLGNLNASTSKDIFPLFRDNQIWYGQSIKSGDRKFYVPDSYPFTTASSGIDEDGRRFIKVTGVRWFTNLENNAHRQPLPLTQHYDPGKNPAYDNYDAIEVGRTANIPANYRGIMGVPITFLDKYNPDQFEILMLANGNARSNVP
ncbi:modification methylase, partial [Actinomadura sp. DSM 109109]|nr:modification methylase [Actinomadura lepetitiana]